MDNKTRRDGESMKNGIPQGNHAEILFTEVPCFANVIIKIKNLDKKSN